ncbi:MAG: prepilin-type N-terminal cleavage/methylation domain-containing protein [Pirellulales bacterium]|nr:prepilin-type N-terminal cleavage/methylation domain-containing protein [Pirellulales bacterium]
MYPARNVVVSQGPASPRRGLTLVEILVALVATLIVMGAVISVLGSVGSGIADSRSQIEVSNRLRSAQLLLRSDLAGATCPGIVWQRPEEGNGYFSIIEGPMRDDGRYQLKDNTMPYDLVNNPFVRNTTNGNLPAGYFDYKLQGDVDDILLFTSRSKGLPFVGKEYLNGPNGTATTIQSQVAEVVWFCTPGTVYFGESKDKNGNPTPIQTYNLHRRIFLVKASVGNTFTEDQPLNGNNYFNGSQLRDVANQPNSSPNSNQATNREYATLHSLNLRKNRAFHYNGYSRGGANFNPALEFQIFNNTSQMPLTGNRAGEDIVLSNVLNFDVKVFDPTAPLRNSGGYNVEPTDQGFTNANNPTNSYGTYIDLGIALDPTNPYGANKNNWPLFARGMNFTNPAPGKLYNVPNVTTGPMTCVYDTWSFGYENDALDQDRADGTDQGTDGIDSDGVNGIDDPAERETAPPYPQPLRGVQIRLRVFEPSSKSVRSVSVEETFVPE